MKTVSAASRQNALQRGATLVELVITIVIIGAAMAGVAGAFATLMGRSADPLDQSRATALAQLYMDEILSKPFDHATPTGGVPPYAGSCTLGAEAGESRATFNDVDDYTGINQQAPSSPLGLLDGYSNFRVSITVVCAGDELGLATEAAKRIALSVQTPGAQTYVFAAYRVNF